MPGQRPYGNGLGARACRYYMEYASNFGGTYVPCEEYGVGQEKGGDQER